MFSHPNHHHSGVQPCQLNGDGPLGLAERRLYLSYGFAEIRRDLTGRVNTEYHQSNITSWLEETLRRAVSPLRIYTESILLETIKQHCPSVAMVLDLGCGRGGYWRLFEQIGVSGTYIGVDVQIYPHWSAIRDEENASEITRCFLQARSEHLCLAPGALDFAYSSSSLEHMENDRQAIIGLFDAAKPGSHVLLIVPSSWAHFLYVYHGYRKYSAERLISLCCSAGFEVMQVYALGGLFSFLLHSIWITWLESGQLFDAVFGARLPARILKLLRKASYTPMRTQPALRALYVALLKTCLKLDPLLPLLPAGYAVIAKRSQVY